MNTGLSPIDKSPITVLSNPNTPKMNTATITFNEAVHVLAAGYNNDLAAQALAIHRQRDRAEAALKTRIAHLEDELEAMAGANQALKTQVVALESLVSQRAAAAEQEAYDDLLCQGSDSVLAEEATAWASAQEEEVIDLTGETEDEAPAQPAAKKQRAGARLFSKMTAVLTEGTKLSLTSTGDRWDGVYTKDGLIFQDKAFKSPMAVGKAHAQRITERHPKATQPGNGWIWLKIEDGPYKGKTLAQAHDAHYNA